MGGLTLILEDTLDAREYRKAALVSVTAGVPLFIWGLVTRREGRRKSGRDIVKIRMGFERDSHLISLDYASQIVEEYNANLRSKLGLSLVDIEKYR